MSNIAPFGLIFDKISCSLKFDNSNELLVIIKTFAGSALSQVDKFTFNDFGTLSEMTSGSITVIFAIFSVK